MADDTARHEPPRPVAGDPPISVDVARELGMNEEEYDRIREVLGRVPTYTELGITSAMYSEHCSYKSSKVYLDQFPTEGEHVLQGPGENAGIVDVGHGWVAVFKIESHNHPSYIEPYQGAATGVGGILRDVFTMGARPVACMNALRFGSADAPRMRHLVDGVVRGIGDYGNCVGIPNVGGETGFHASYNGNILVNAFALGLARRDRLAHARAAGIGNPVLYVGSRTGRDGIHGATMASESFGAESEAKRPTVQVGDPFTEKILLEACLEVLRTGAVVAIQDMGAAGLTSSSFEMAGRGHVGMRLDLDRVPLRESLTPYEIMLSESQERMLLVAERGRVQEVANVFEKWRLEVVSIGEITENQHAQLFWHGEQVADMPIRALTHNAPIYRRPVEVPPDLAARHEPPEVPVAEDPGGILERLLDTPQLGSKEWIWRQYDHTVRTSTVSGPGGDAAVLRMKGTPAGLAMTTDVNPVYCYLDPNVGGAQAVAEAVRNLACVGAEPVGLTDCLNFGSPENPHIAWQFRECVEGMSRACRALEVPVISGNVSFYNETDGNAIHPTPTVSVVGVIPDLSALPSPTVTVAGERVVLLGEDRGEFGGSAYLRLLYDTEKGRPPLVDLGDEQRLADLLRMLVFEKLVRGAHDVSEGGLAVTLAEMCFGPAGIGLDVTVATSPTWLFSETQARAVLTVAPDHVDRVLEEAEAFGVPAVDIGETGGERLVIRADGARIDTEVAALRAVWQHALPRAFGF
ncbi:MAG: phosphoribosylformylglycinamidine synthase subunit PurL [Acidobacteriota bacterium]